MQEAYVMVFATTDSEERARELARGIVEARLAACVQVEAIRSIYRWQDAVHDEPEWRLVIKTRADRYPDLEQYIKAHHTYATPEIVRVEIAGGSKEYLHWLDECVG